MRRERRSQVSSETEYAFRHVLVRDVAYGQIPRGRRANKHRAVAEWIGQLAPDRAEDHAEMLAHHYLSALEFARAAGQPTEALAEPARLALRAAGDRSAALNAFPAAERFYRAALEIWPRDDVERSDLLLRLGRTFYRRGPGGEGVLEEAAEALLESGDLEGAAEAMALRADGLLDGVRASALLERLTPWLEAAGALVAGEPARAAEIYGHMGARPQEAFARLHAAERLIAENRRTEGDAELQRALAFFRSVGARAYIARGKALLVASA